MNIALGCITSGHLAFKPPRRRTVSESAAETLYIKNANKFYDPDETAYMRQPMDDLARRDIEAVIFVGPSRTGKTVGLIDGWMARNVVDDPGDMLIVQMTQDKAREFSKVRMDRAIEFSPALHAMRSNRRQDDNTFDKMFANGMWLKIGWPSVSQLSSSDYRYVGLTDYDRMPENIDEEGDAFTLGLKRTQTFMSRGMCMAESSPGYNITDPNWQAATPHEAPPVKGILSLYNRGDRKRQYWKCHECFEYFQVTPGLGLFNLPEEKELMEMVRSANIDEMATEYATVKCPHCGGVHMQKQKRELNRTGVWLADFQSIDENGVISGPKPTASIASYWLSGVAAEYQNWRSLILGYLQALREYMLTGSELGLQANVNTSQGSPYLSRALLAAINQSSPQDRKENRLKYVVPREARYVVAKVDIQGGQDARFVVQVHAYGAWYEQWVIDRFAITQSRRPGTDGHATVLDPASYAEDWDMLTELVLDATYQIEGMEDMEIRARVVVIDTGGEDGVADKAYQWYRKMRAVGKNNRIMLIKGASLTAKTTLTTEAVRQSMVGAANKGETGDIPLYMLNTNYLKDLVKSSLEKQEAGPDYIHFPDWLPDSFFDELTKSEIRMPDGTWMKKKKRNEALDLAAYSRAGCIALGINKIMDWSMVPGWLLRMDQGNTDIISATARREAHAKTAAMLVGQPQTQMPTRRMTSSRYVRR